MAIFLCEWRSRIRLRRGRWCSKSRPPTGRTGRRSSGSLAWISTRRSVSRFPFRSRRSDRGCFASTTSEASCHRTCVSLGARRRSDVETAPAMLVVSSRPVDCTGYIRAAGGSRDAMRFGALPATDASALAEVVPPDSLPDSWIDYSGLDFVAISRDDLADLKPSSRSAVLKWVHCGGNLIVHQAGKTSKDVETLERLLELPENAAVGARWTESDGRKTPSPFATRQLMLGLVCAFPDQLPDSPIDWSAFLSSVGEPRFSWMQRHGIAPDFGTEEFFNFMNPGIRGVPVYGFMVLITAFAVLIGPVNYFYLRRKRLLWLLLVTVPATALVTSVLLVGYSVAAHGFSIRSRIRSLTVLDQKSHSAVTVARLALFAGVAPRAACSFPRKRPSIRCSRQRSSRARSRSTGPRTNR